MFGRRSPFSTRLPRRLAALTVTSLLAGSIGVLTVVTAPAASAALDTTLYAVASTTIYTLNESNGAATALPGTLPFSTNAIARQPGSNLIYYYEAASPYRVGTYNVVTNATTTLSGNGPDSLVRLAFRADGFLYGMASDNTLYRFNTTTGTASSSSTVAGPALTGGGGDIAFLPDNDAYVVVGSQLFSLPSPYTTVTLVGSTTGDTNAHPSLAFGSSGRLWTASSTSGGNSDVGYLNLSSGAQTTVTATAAGIQFSDMASVPDRAPTASSTTASTAYLTPVTTDVSSLVSDPDGDPVTVTGVSVIGGSSVGTATIDGSNRPVFTPATGFSGVATVNYTVSDGLGGTATSTISVTVGNASPAFSSATSNSSQTVARGAAPVALAGTDPNPSDTVSYSLTSGSLPTGVTLNSSGTFSGTATTRGTFTAGVAITDNHGASTPGTLVITVPNVAPVFTGAPTNTSQTVIQGTALTALAATDAEGDPLTYALASGSLPPGVTLTSSGTFSGTPTASGVFAVTVTVADGHGGLTSRALTISVNAATAPNVTADATTTTVDTAATTSVLDNDSDPAAYPLSVTAITQPANGTAVLGAAGVVTYSPAAGWSGTDSYTYTVTNGHGGSATGTVTVTVLPVAVALTSTGTSTAPQTATAPVPVGGSATLLDNGIAVSSVVVAGQGTYTDDGSTGVITFVPVAGFQGAATPVSYRVTDSSGLTATSTYAPTVNAPGGPSAAAKATTGVGGASQTTLLTVPAGSSVTLLTASGTPATTVTAPGQGTYVLDAATHVLTFTPLPGFAGVATPVTYRITDGYGTRAQATYTATVTSVPATASAASTTGPAGGTQTTTVTVPNGGAVTLIGADGRATNSLTVRGGTYTLDPVTGTIVFTPARGFLGTAAPVTFRVTTAQGATADATYTAVVKGTALVPRATIAINNLAVAGAGKSVNALCSVNTGRVAYCSVTLTTVIHGRTVRIGYGKVVVKGAGTPGPVTVRVRLTSQGRLLADRPGGVSVTATGTARAIGSSAVVMARKNARIVAPKVFVLRPVFFDTDKSLVHPVDLAYLTGLRAKLTGVRLVTCTGYTDSREPNDYNYELGLARARAVCSFLLRGTGLHSVTVSYGETRPQATNRTVRGMALNRRTEITLSY